MRVLALPGSLRRDSHNARLLRAAAPLLPPGVELAAAPSLAGIPPYDADHDGGEGAQPEAVERLKAAIADADAVLVATPEYNGSMPGVLKNALDWVSRPLVSSPLREKPAAVVGASTGMFGAVWAQAETRKVLNTIGARTLEHELPVGGADDVFVAGEDHLADPELTRTYASLLGDLVATASEEESLAA